MSEENEAVVRRVQEEIINGKNMDLLDELLGEDYIWHGPGQDAGKEIYEMYLSAFPDLKMKIEERIAVGDKVISRFVTEGTHRADLPGIPATGKHTAGIAGIVISRLENGQIVEEWESFDELGMMKQIGAVDKDLNAKEPEDLDATWQLPSPNRRL